MHPDLCVHTSDNAAAQLSADGGRALASLWMTHHDASEIVAFLQDFPADTRRMMCQSILAVAMTKLPWAFKAMVIDDSIRITTR